MGHRETGQEEDVAAEVKAWHDGGPKPGSWGAVENAKAKTATVAPWIAIQLYRDPLGEWAPAHACHTAKQALYDLEILAGSHTAVTFRGAKGVDIRSDNEAAIAMDPHLWIDDNPGKDVRSIFFYGERLPTPDLSDGFVHFDPTKLSVRVRQYGGRAFQPLVLIWLNGPSLSLNSADLPAYDVNVNRRISTSITRTGHVTPQRCIDMVLEMAAQNYGEPIANLVINCHGGMDHSQTRGYLSLGHDYEYFEVGGNPRPKGDHGTITGNVGFTRHNRNIWQQLRGKVRHIWFQACYVGNDGVLCEAVAKGAGAWVTAATMRTAIKSSSVPADHIEYLYPYYPKHWAPDGSTIKAEEFFRRARHSNQGALKDCLYFNIVKAI